jgi:hypothetical protein
LWSIWSFESYHDGTTQWKHDAYFEEGTRVRHSSKAAELGNAGLDGVTHLKMSFGGNEDAATWPHLITYRLRSSVKKLSSPTTMVGTPTTMQMADVAGYTPATIQTTPAPIIPIEIR